jgi:16S rRNA processing protein RimM
MPEERLCLAAVAGAHGVRGLVKLKTFTETPEDVAAYGPLTDESGARRFTLELKGRAKGGVIAALEGVATREEAEALKGLRLYAPRAALPAIEEEETYYQADLVGLAVETRGGEALGSVAAVQNYGAGDFLEIRRDDGTSLTLPFTKAAVPVVDVAGGRIVAAPPEELDAKPESEESPAND